MFKYFPDLNDLSIAMGTMDKVWGGVGKPI